MVHERNLGDKRTQFNWIFIYESFFHSPKYDDKFTGYT
jgi:hypothetical protein